MLEHNLATLVEKFKKMRPNLQQEPPSAPPGGSSAMDILRETIEALDSRLQQLEQLKTIRALYEQKAPSALGSPKALLLSLTIRDMMVLYDDAIEAHVKYIDALEGLKQKAEVLVQDDKHMEEPASEESVARIAVVVEKQDGVAEVCREVLAKLLRVVATQVDVAVVLRSFEDDAAGAGQF